jgi:[lysine-biosynthesis-protein LysW]--L-2-aminoadipate ligase
MKIGILLSRLRIEEKLIFNLLRERDVDFERINDGRLVFDLEDRAHFETFDVVWSRSLSHSRAYYALKILNSWGIKTVNTHEVINTCGDKVLTTTALLEAGLPTPRTLVAFDVDSALKALETIGYPAVLKPPVGSWGRLLAKINDREAAEAILEHKQTLGGYQHSIFYVQEYVDKPQRDIRAIVAGDEAICAIYRESPHWITNTARGGEATRCPLTADLEDLAVQAAKAMGGGILAVDLLEDADGRLLISEVNHTPEFHGAIEVAGEDIPDKMVDYVLQVASS